MIKNKRKTLSEYSPEKNQKKNPFIKVMTRKEENNNNNLMIHKKNRKASKNKS